MDDTKKNFTLDDVIRIVSQNNIAGLGANPPPLNAPAAYSPQSFSSAPGTMPMEGNYDVITQEDKFRKYFEENMKNEDSSSSSKSSGKSSSQEPSSSQGEAGNPQHPLAIVSENIIEGAGSRLKDPATYENMNPAQLAQTVASAASLRDQMNFVDAAATTPFTYTNPQDQEYAARVADMTGQPTDYKEPVSQGGPNWMEKLGYAIGGPATPRMQESLSFAQKRGESRGGLVPELEKGYLTAQAPLGTFEQAQLAQQERLRMSEIAIQQQQTQKGRAEVGLATMFPGTKWIKPLQPASVRDYMEGTDPGSIGLTAEQIRRPVSKAAASGTREQIEAIRSRAPQGSYSYKRVEGGGIQYFDSNGKPIRKKGK